MRAARFTSVIAAGAIALSLAACGTSSSGATRTRDLSGAQRIVAGYDSARDERGARMDGELSVRVAGRDMTIPLEGAIDFTHDATRFSMSLEGLGLPGLGDAGRRDAGHGRDGRLLVTVLHSSVDRAPPRGRPIRVPRRARRRRSP